MRTHSPSLFFALTACTTLALEITHASAEPPPAQPPPSAALAAQTPAAPAKQPPATPSCTPDPALGNAAAELLLTGHAPNSQQLLAAIRTAGSETTTPHALFLPTDDPARVTQWLGDIRAKSDSDLICGDARSERSRLLIASARAATLRVERGALHGSLAASFDKPELVFRRSDGSLARVAVTRDELARGVPIDPEWDAIQVQLLAWGPNGPRPVAERSLRRDGAPAGDELSLSSDAPLDASGVADVLTQLRARHGRQVLRRNRLADGIAKQHASAVCAQGKVAHELEPGVDPETRVARAGLKAQLTGETVARAADAGAAIQALWQSPSHSLTLLERRFTDVGIGLATDPQQRTCLVVLLLAWPRPVPRASPTAAR